MRRENPTVYSTEVGRVCPKCGRPVDACICKSQFSRARGDGIVRIQRDSKSRKGKTVTLITGIPLNDEDLHTLASELKRLCGSGGAVKEGIIEIQGDHRETLQEILKKRGYKVKLAGG
jgi:translation initiation factor 1